MATTIKDVAREAGVSTASVSRTISGKSPVSGEVKEKVLEAIDRLGYRPNALARSLREESTGMVGLVVSNVLNPFFTSLARSVEDAVGEQGYSVVLCNADEDPIKEERYLDILLQKRVDGLVVSPARAESPALSKVVEAEVPVVLVDRSIGGVGAPVARVDGRRAVEELVRYLTRLGHERLAVISGPPEVISGGERLEAFLDCAEEQGVPVPEECVRLGDFRRQSGTEAMSELLSLDLPPTAVFAANNLMALGALQTIKASGLKIPHDMSLASFDDVSWFPFTEPPLTAIAQPTAELGVTAAGMLLEIIEAGQRPESLVLGAELVIRGSCGEPRSRRSDD